MVVEGEEVHEKRGFTGAEGGKGRK